MSGEQSTTFSVRTGFDDDGIAGLTRQAVHAEAAGFDQIWTGNDFLGSPGIPALCSMLIATNRIRVGSGILDPVTIHPAQLAQLASGLQEMSGDRFILGLGAGSDLFFAKAGITAAKPVPRTRAAVVAIRELTHGRSPAGVRGAGENWQPGATIQRPRPVDIYVGAMGPKMLHMTGRYADGALPLCLPPRQVHRVIAQIGAGAEAAGRALDDLDVAACVWCAIDDDRMVAELIMAKHIAHYSGSLSTDALAASGLDPEEFARTQALVDSGDEEGAIASVLRSDSMLSLGIVGGAREVIEQCAEVIAAGARHISFGPPFSIDSHRAIALLGEQVLPELRRMRIAATS